MKPETKRWLARSAFVALVAIGTLVAAPRFAAGRSCPEWSAGTCPPLTEWPDTGPGSCYQACVDLNYSAGFCRADGCCLCALR